MATPQFIWGAAGKIILVNGKPLIVSADSLPTTSLALVPWNMRLSSGYTTRFQVHTSAASGDTAGNVPILISWTGGQPNKVEARIMQGTTQIVGWTDITSTLVLTGAASAAGTLNNVPAGIGYKREVRVGAQSAVDTQLHNIGIMVLPWGQSNMTNMLAGSGYPTVPGTSGNEAAYFNSNGTGAFYTPYGYTEGCNNNITVYSGNTNGAGSLSMLRLVGAALEAKFGRKVGVTINPVMKNGTGMSGFMSQLGVIPLFGNTSTVAGGMGFSPPVTYLPTGDFRIFALHQGETLDTYTSTRAQRYAEIKLLVKAGLAQVAQFGRQPNQVTFLFCIMGVVTSASAQHIEILRGAVMDLINDPEAIAGGWDIRIASNCIDMDPVTYGDGLHIGAPDLRVSLRRIIASMMNVVNPTMVPYGARGPKLAGTYTRSSNVVTLDVQHNGGTALAAKNSGSPITGWYANSALDFSGTYYTVQSVTTDGVSKISVTVVDSGGNPVLGTFYLKHCGGKAIAAYDANSYHPDVSNLIYDNLVYPAGVNAADQFTGLPLLPTPDAIKVT